MQQQCRTTDEPSIETNLQFAVAAQACGRCYHADELIERTGVTYTIAEDPDGVIHRAFRGFAMPTTILISADGTVARSHAGAISADQLRGFIAEDFGP